MATLLGTISLGVAEAQLATDDFNRSNGALGANWGGVTGLGALFVVSNTVEASGGSLGQRYTAVSAPADQYAKLTLTTLRSVSDEGIGPAVRMAAGANTSYFVLPNTTDIHLYKVVAGSFNLLGSAGGAATNDVIELDAVGTAITVKKNGTTVIGPITDSAISSGDWGIVGSSTGGVVDGDNWEGGAPGGGTTTTTALKRSAWFFFP